MKNKSTREPFVTLTKAFRRIKEKWPEAPLFALREAVRSGKVLARRSSDAKKARYYVKVSELEAWYLSNANMQ